LLLVLEREFYMPTVEMVEWLLFGLNNCIELEKNKNGWQMILSTIFRTKLFLIINHINYEDNYFFSSKIKYYFTFYLVTCLF